jgi:hypothetical protein
MKHWNVSERWASTKPTFNSMPRLKGNPSVCNYASIDYNYDIMNLLPTGTGLLDNENGVVELLLLKERMHVA